MHKSSFLLSFLSNEGPKTSYPTPSFPNLATDNPSSQNRFLITVVQLSEHKARVTEIYPKVCVFSEIWKTGNLGMLSDHGSRSSFVFQKIW